MGNVFHVQRFCLGRCVLLVHLKTALSSKQEHVRLLSGNLVYLMMEGNRDARKLLEAFLPKVTIFTCLLDVLIRTLFAGLDFSSSPYS